VAEQSEAVVLSRVELPDGRVLAFRDVQVVGFNLFEAQQRASRGAHGRSQVIAELNPRDDGMWQVSDPVKGMDFVGELAAAVLLSYAAVEGLGKYAIDQMEQGAIGGVLWDKFVRLRRLRDELVRPRPAPQDSGILGRFMRGDADTCAEDAIAVVRALRPEFAPAMLLQAP
jgi:hypothetical protein